MYRWVALLLVTGVTRGIAFGAVPSPALPDAPASAVLVELFTSEGCSSCPPADDLLRSINRKTTAGKQLIVGLSEHVTYWNHLGWQDPYSLQVFTDRQEAYASHFAGEGPYTPQMVLNGREAFVGSDRGQLVHALQNEAAQPGIALRIVSAKVAADRVDVDLALSGQTDGPLDILATLTDDADRSSVQRGENAGAVLQHVAVARSLEKVGTVTTAAEQHLEVHLPASLRGPLHRSHSLVLFLQQPQQGAVLGAAVEEL